MKYILYIGIYNEGSISKMRADKLESILSDWNMSVINTDIPKRAIWRVWQSIGFRYEKEPLINKVDRYVLNNLEDKHHGLIWVDKAIYLKKQTTLQLWQHVSTLVYFTPDPAFSFYRLDLFYESMPLYGYMIITKSFEMEDFIGIMGSKDKVLYATQGFDKALHRPFVEWEKKKGVALIGHCEEERGMSIIKLLQSGIDVTLVGIDWDKLVKSYPSPCLNYLGHGVFGEDCVRVLSGCSYAWGSVSKWIPEEHTTCTSEIPVYKIALLTERNDKIEGFFSEDEVIYYDGIEDLIVEIEYYNGHSQELKTLVERGYHKVQTDGFDYKSAIRSLLEKVKAL